MTIDAIAEAHRQIIRADLASKTLRLAPDLRTRAERALSGGRATRAELAVVAHECALARTTSAVPRRKAATPDSHSGRLAVALESLTSNTQAFAAGVKDWLARQDRVVALLEKHQGERDALESPTDEGALACYERQARESASLRSDLDL